MHVLLSSRRQFCFRSFLFLLTLLFITIKARKTPECKASDKVFDEYRADGKWKWVEIYYFNASKQIVFVSFVKMTADQSKLRTCRDSPMHLSFTQVLWFRLVFSVIRFSFVLGYFFFINLALFHFYKADCLLCCLYTVFVYVCSIQHVYYARSLKSMKSTSQILSIVTSQAALQVFCKAVGFSHVELIILKVKQLEATARK